MIISFRNDFLAPTYQVNSRFNFFLNLKTLNGFIYCFINCFWRYLFCWKIILKLFYMDVFHVNGWGNIGKSFQLSAMPTIQWKIIWYMTLVIYHFSRQESQICLKLQGFAKFCLSEPSPKATNGREFI